MQGWHRQDARIKEALTVVPVWIIDLGPKAGRLSIHMTALVSAGTKQKSNFHWGYIIYVNSFNSVSVEARRSLAWHLKNKILTVSRLSAPLTNLRVNKII